MSVRITLYLKHQIYDYFKNIYIIIDYYNKDLFCLHSLTFNIYVLEFQIKSILLCVTVCVILSYTF